MWPPQPGTVALQQLHGAGLLCVRYRRDVTGLKRLTTVELVVSEGPLQRRPRNAQLCAVQTYSGEQALRAALHAAGARWDMHTHQWIARRDVIKQLGLQDRIIKPPRK